MKHRHHYTGHGLHFRYTLSLRDWMTEEMTHVRYTCVPQTYQRLVYLTETGYVGTASACATLTIPVGCHRPRGHHES